jgi:hypothetical protein
VTDHAAKLRTAFRSRLREARDLVGAATAFAVMLKAIVIAWAVFVVAERLLSHSRSPDVPNNCSQFVH